MDKKIFSGYRPLILSRHPSHEILRTELAKLPVRSVVRLGSVTERNDGKARIELNSTSAIRISSNKRLMKEAFSEANCPTAPWITAGSIDEILDALEQETLRLPIVAKHVNGSRGKGNTLLRTETELTNWAHNRKFENYIFENYMAYLLEYRLHVTKNGSFYSCRKALIKTTVESERWRRHKDNSVWLLETNPDFHRPSSWEDIEKSCVAALNKIGADILSFDVRVQSRLSKKGEPRSYQEFILIECNSASSLSSPRDGVQSVVSQRYLEIIPKLIMEKRNTVK